MTKAAYKNTPDLISPSEVSRTMKDGWHNTLGIYLHEVFDRLIGWEEVCKYFAEMGVGTSTKFRCEPIFWRIDPNGNVRTGRVATFDYNTGKETSNGYWIHELINRPNCKPCLFGAHRIGIVEKELGTTKPIIGVFESEAAALTIGLIFHWLGMENFIFPVAYGETLNLTEEMKRDLWSGIRLLKGRTVVLFPDEGKYEEWKLKGLGLKGYCEKVYVSTVMEKNLHPYPIGCKIEKGDGLDDAIIRLIKGGTSADIVSNLLLTAF